MARTIFKTEEPVVLEGYQAVLKPSKFGFTLMAIVDQDMADKLDSDRPGSLKWAESKLKNPKRATLKPEPWEEVAEGKYKVKFTWKDDNKPVIVDTEGTPITDENVPVYSGSKVKLAFYQKPYSLPTGTIGTRLVMEAIQVVALSGSAGVDVGDAEDIDPAAMFGKTEGFKLGDPNVVSDVSNDAALEDDF